jgi:biopolymer transport protein ExbD
VLLKKRAREEAEIPSSSLADIAFLLLIFFLVTTTIDVDTGIGLVLPPPPEPDQEPPPIKERNLLKILVNSQGLILLDDQPVVIQEVKDKVKEFIKNPTNDPDLSENPLKAIVSLKTDRQTPYKIYIDMLDELVGAYDELWEEAAQTRFGKTFERLNDAEVIVVKKEMYPKKLSEAEPDKGN